MLAWVLAGMLHAKSKKPKDADFVAVAKDLAALLSDATAAAPIQPDYYAQVAAHMIDVPVHPFLHFAEQALQVVDVHMLPRYAVTVVPTASPAITRRRLPAVRRLKTTIGSLLSMHREMAVASITLSPCSST